MDGDDVDDDGLEEDGLEDDDVDDQEESDPDGENTYGCPGKRCLVRGKHLWVSG